MDQVEETQARITALMQKSKSEDGLLPSEKLELHLLLCSAPRVKEDRKYARRLSKSGSKGH